MQNNQQNNPNQTGPSAANNGISPQMQIILNNPTNQPAANTHTNTLNYETLISQILNQQLGQQSILHSLPVIPESPLEDTAQPNLTPTNNAQGVQGPAAAQGKGA